MTIHATTVRTLFALAGLAVSLGLGACAQHGKHTGELKEQAQNRVTQMKSATSWDMAHQQYLAGDLDKALRSVEQSIALNDKVAKSHLLRGRILLEMGRLEPALLAFEATLAIEPEQADSHYYRGIIFERFSKSEQALAEYQAAAKADPTNAQYILASAEMLMELGRLDEAESLMTNARDSFQNNAGIRQTLGHIAMMRQQYERAATLFGEAALLGPDDQALVEDLARAQVAAKQFGQADSTLRRLLDADPKGARRDLRYLRARCLVELNQPVEARSILVKLVADGGMNDTRAWSELGNIALILDDDYRAREAASRLIALAPTSPDGYVILAVADRRAGRPDKAVATLNKAITFARNDPTPAKLQGLIYQEMGRQADAAKSFGLALKADPRDTEASRLLAAANRAAKSGLANVNDE